MSGGGGVLELVMRHPRAVVLSIASAMTLSSVPAGAQVREQKPDLVVAEVGGRGLILSAAYERFMVDELGIGGGIGVVPGTWGWLVVLPVYGALVLGESHALYLGAGATLTPGGGHGDDRVDSQAVGTFSVGYQYQSSGGFVVRPLLTLLVNDGYVGLWPGVAVGTAF
jgi:hypothetical protein